MLSPIEASADGVPDLRCFKAKSRGGAVERICESAGVVTVEVSPEGDAPSPSILRAHAAHRLPSLANTGQPSGPQPPSSIPVDWSGLRVGLGPWGALSHPAASSGFGLLAHATYDVVPADAPSFVLGLRIDQDVRPATGRTGDPRTAAVQAVTSINLRVGTVLWSRFMPYLTAGLASSTQHLALGGGSDVGAGVTYAIDERWSVSLDYRHTDLRVVDPALGLTVPGRSTAPVSIDSVAATLNCKVL